MIFSQYSLHWYREYACSCIREKKHFIKKQFKFLELSNLEQQVLHMSCNWHTVCFFINFHFLQDDVHDLQDVLQDVDGLLQDVQDAHG